MATIGLDLGTTRWKAAVFGPRGNLVQLVTGPMPTVRDADGSDWFDKDGLWRALVAALRELASSGDPIEGIGVASMAEAGVLVDRRTGEARTHILPWFDRRPLAFAEMIAREHDALSLFQRSGLRCGFKYGLPKLLWLRAQNEDLLDDAVWLSVADYVVYRLTGRMVTDPTLAARTFAYNLPLGRWDDEWIRSFGLSLDLFPEVRLSGEPAGTVTPEVQAATGLPRSTTAAVAGHDHLCALPVAEITAPGPVLDSIGTAESMLGVLQDLDLGGAVFESDLSIVPHVLPGRYCWLGGQSSAGGAIEWLRAALGVQSEPYRQFVDLARGTGDEPTGILFLPYLSGSGAPWHDGRVRAAFLGLDAAHGAGHLARAVLEGTAYATESIRRAAEVMTGRSIESLIAVGGGTRNEVWMQIRADVSGCTHFLPRIDEAVALGAALLAALGRGALGLGDIEAVARERRDAGARVEPDMDRHEQYRRIFDDGFLPLQGPVRRLGRLQEDWASQRRLSREVGVR